MRVLVCGDRNWMDKKMIRKVLDCVWKAHQKTGLHIIDGAAPGADTLAYQIRKEEGYSGERYPANWHEQGKKAGPIRNQKMLDEGKPKLVLAFHDNLKESKGTKDMLLRATNAGIPVRVYSHGV